MIPLGRRLHGVHVQLAPLAGPAGIGVLVDGDARLVGQPADGVDEVQVVDGPHEGDGVAFGLAPEAVVEALFGIDAERRRLLGVERESPLQRRPTRLRATCSPMSATMSVPARTRATSSSGMPMDDGRYREATAAESPSSGLAAYFLARALAPWPGPTRPRPTPPGRQPAWR